MQSRDREAMTRTQAYALGIRLYLAADGVITQQEPSPPFTVIEPAAGGQPTNDHMTPVSEQK